MPAPARAAPSRAHLDRDLVPAVPQVAAGVPHRALGLRGRERFDVLLVTPGWLLERHGRRGIVPGRGLLVVFEWSYERVRAWLARQVEGCTGRTWPEVARKVGRLATWEGEGAEVIGLR